MTASHCSPTSPHTPAPGWPLQGPGAPCWSHNKTQLRTKLEARLGSKLIFNPWRSSLFSMANVPPPSDCQSDMKQEIANCTGQGPEFFPLPGCPLPNPHGQWVASGLQAVGGSVHFPWRTSILAPRTDCPVGGLRVAGSLRAAGSHRELAQWEEGRLHPHSDTPMEPGRGDLPWVELGPAEKAWVRAGRKTGPSARTLSRLQGSVAVWARWPREARSRG